MIIDLSCTKYTKKRRNTKNHNMFIKLHRCSDKPISEIEFIVKYIPFYKDISKLHERDIIDFKG